VPGEIAPSSGFSRRLLTPKIFTAVVRRPAPSALGKRVARVAYPYANSAFKGLPLLIRNGRPRGSRISVTGSMPRVWRIVAPMSSGLTGSRDG
jgi:hypothetical protein